MCRLAGIVCEIPSIVFDESIEARRRGRDPETAGMPAYLSRSLAAAAAAAASSSSSSFQPTFSVLGIPLNR